MNRTKLSVLWPKYVFDLLVTLTLTFDLWEDRELKSEHFGIGFISIGRKLSMLWPKYVFDLFVTLTLTFDLSEDRELKSEHFGIGFISIGRKLSVLWPKYFLTFLWPWPWPLTYQRIGNWKVNILTLVSYESDENWVCYNQYMFLTFLWPWPWPLTYQRIGNWKVNLLAFVSYESDKNWACYDQYIFSTFLWPSPLPLTWSLPKSNQVVLRWWQIIPENFMQFGPVVFGTFVTLTLTFDLIAPKI